MKRPREFSSQALVNPACALLVLSCDAYADLWNPFFTLLDRYWPDCPFPIYLGTGKLNSGFSGITTLTSDGGRDWSKCAQDYLDQIPHPYVLIMLDDFFLRQMVPTVEVLRCLDFARQHEALQVRLIPRPGPTDRVTGETLVGESAPGSPYRLSTQAAIWNRAALRALLQPGESIWNFEHQGNIRALSMPTGFFSVWHPVLPYEGLFAHHVVEKGQWLPHEKWLFGRQNIGCDFTRRSTLSWGQTLLYHTAQTLDRMLNVFPWPAKIRLKHGLKRILYPLMPRQFSRMSGTASSLPEAKPPRRQP